MSLLIPSRPIFLLPLYVTLLFASGCGGDGFDVASVKGTVRCNGVPVPGGIVFFEPKQTGKSALVGKTGFGVIDKQGKFTISTYGDGDGAIVGPHIIKVEQGSGPECDCVMNGDKVVMEVEVKEAADNTFEIDLPKMSARELRKAKSRSYRGNDDEDEDEEVKLNF